MIDMHKFSLRLADYIKTRRAELAITQEELAEISGIDSKHIQNLESYKKINDPKLSTLYKLAIALDDEVSNILDYIENNNDYRSRQKNYNTLLAVSDDKKTTEENK